MKTKVTKLTDEKIMREACEATFLGKSKISLIDMYLMEHSPSRTQLFWIQLEDIPLFVSTHLLRHHVGSQPYALTHRNDRKGGGIDLEDVCDDSIGMIEAIRHGDTHVASEETLLDMVKDNVSQIKEKGGRNAPTNLSLMINAQSLIDMAKYRMCKQASKETRQVFDEICKAIHDIDYPLWNVLVPKCVYRNGLCHKSCGWNKTDAFKELLSEYVELFK